GRLLAQVQERRRAGAEEPSPLFEWGARAAAEATADLTENAPNVDPNSAKGFAYDIAQGFVQMIPAVGTTLITRRPVAGGGVTGGRVYGQRYAESIEAGRTPERATADATFYAMSEAIPEMIPLGLLIKPGGRFLSRTLRVGGAEAIQEVMTEALQMGYDAGGVDETTAWGELARRLAGRGSVGAGSGRAPAG